MASKRIKFAFKVGRMARTTRFLPGYPVGIPCESLVTVLETSTTYGGRYRVESASGTRLWIDADGLEALDAPAV